MRRILNFVILFYASLGKVVGAVLILIRETATGINMLVKICAKT